MMHDSRTRESDYIFISLQIELFFKHTKKIKYISINLNYTWLMILDNPNPNEPKKMAGSIDIKAKARRTNELLTDVESPAIPTWGNVSLSIICKC